MGNTDNSLNLVVKLEKLQLLGETDDKVAIFCMDKVERKAYNTRAGCSVPVVVHIIHVLDAVY